MEFVPSLETQKHFLASLLRQMITNGKAWAVARGLSRKNPVHGMEEYRIPENSDFSFETTNTREMEVTGSANMEDASGALLTTGADFSADAAIAPPGVLFGTHLNSGEAPMVELLASSRRRRQQLPACQACRWSSKANVPSVPCL